MLVFVEGRKTREPGEKPSEQGKNQQIQPTYDTDPKSNTGHIGERRALSPLRLACSRLSVVGDERKRARKKRGRTKARSGGRACKTFFNDPLLV